MTKQLPKLDPATQGKVDQLHAAAVELVDRYVSGLEIDMNRHAVKHGAMDETRAHNDLTMLFTQQVNTGQIPANMVNAMLAEALLRLIKRKRGGRG